MSDLPKKLFVLVIGLFSAIYVFNPGAGFIELIPDNFPIVGNLDEAAAATLLIAALSYFGLDLTKLFGKVKPPAEDLDSWKNEKSASGKVVEEN